MIAVPRDDAGRFLSAVLQRIQAEIGQIGRFLVAVDAEDGAFVVKLIGIQDGKFFAHTQPLFLT